MSSPKPVSHSTLARAHLMNPSRAAWHDGALWHVRERRDIAVRSVPEWESLREHAAQIKRHALANLGPYLEQFEAEATATGATVHWAENGSELCTTVTSLLKERGISEVVKSKSMLTEECHLNRHLEQQNISVTDTDLGEWIVQLRNEAPTHIVLPAIHVKKEEVGELLEKTIGLPHGEADPAVMTRAACDELRNHYRTAGAAISGANFIVADSGTVVLCTNEGNADLGITLTPLHIVCVGIEKLVPRTEDLGTFLRLLARSATGQPITVYTSLVRGPAADVSAEDVASNPAINGIASGAAKRELHIILVDNGRTNQLADSELRSALSCIRCGACLNTCPVYRRSGGASYGWTIPGPIGSVLAPSRFPEQFASLPFASTLCGSCTAVCPVKIPLHEQLLLLRGRIAAQGNMPRWKTTALAVMSKVFQSPAVYERAGKLGRLLLRWLPYRVLHNRLNPWSGGRDLPAAPRESFHEWHRRTKGAP